VKLGVAGHSIVALAPCPPIVGGVMSWTLTVLVQVLEQLLALVMVRFKVKLALQPLPAVTVTVWPLVEPMMEPLPEIDQR